jgi:uncharacterized protein
MQRVILAYSGGTDSTFLLRVALDVIPGGVVAATARSPIHPAWELNEAELVARKLGAEMIVVDTREMALEEFVANSPDRCYHCKSEIFRRLADLARGRMADLVDGSNSDDWAQWRPGRRAALEQGVRSPLMEAGLSKDEIRLLSRDMGLPNWNRPSFSCLASSFPYGQRITVPDLQRVELADAFLRQLGVGQVRVRIHDDLARIELEGDDISRLAAADLRKRVIRRLKELGYRYVTLDLEGYRSGSFDATLEESGGN